MSYYSTLPASIITASNIEKNQWPSISFESAPTPLFFSTTSSGLWGALHQRNMDTMRKTIRLELAAIESRGVSHGVFNRRTVLEGCSMPFVSPCSACTVAFSSGRTPLQSAVVLLHFFWVCEVEVQDPQSEQSSHQWAAGSSAQCATGESPFKGVLQGPNRRVNPLLASLHCRYLASCLRIIRHQLISSCG
jgi:hypothetical protein